LTWYAGASTGGTPVIDYRVWYQLGTGSGSYSVLATAVNQTSYSATSLAMGSTYTFIVQARNAYGYGVNSTAS